MEDEEIIATREQAIKALEAKGYEIVNTLFTGTVVPRQAGEFAAILGDNHRETEVVSPLSTIKQALAEALKEIGSGLGGGDIHLTIELDGDVVYKKVVERNKERTVLSGRNPLLV